MKQKIKYVFEYFRSHIFIQLFKRSILSPILLSVSIGIGLQKNMSNCYWMKHRNHRLDITNWLIFN